MLVLLAALSDCNSLTTACVYPRVKEKDEINRNLSNLTRGCLNDSEALVTAEILGQHRDRVKRPSNLNKGDRRYLLPDFAGRTKSL
jgi:hypothetical protein